MSTIVLPYCAESHWSVACIFLKSHVICHYDPMGAHNASRHRTVFHAAQRLVDLLNDEFMLGSSRNAWECRVYQHGPFQTNSNDCGLFVLQAIELFARIGPTDRLPRDPLDLWIEPQTDQVAGQVMNLRARTSYELVVGSLLPRPPPRSISGP